MIQKAGQKPGGVEASTIAAQAGPWRVLGLDPGLRLTGYAVLQAVRQDGAWQPQVCEAGILRVNERRRGAAALAARLRTLYDGLNELLDEWQPAALAVEQLYAHYAHPRTAILMAHARGVFLLAGALRNLPVVGYPPTHVKKLITGNGRASKTQMQYAIAAQLGLDRLPQPADVADALAVALCHYL
ncbi:MAG: crossover junction endodeoxyribonuclease RuvC, partial [Gemmataceae bacterium]|nr:crossover junction endodeoxyribonuclease RuvC [Gemmataceae bacterium]